MSDERTTMLLIAIGELSTVENDGEQTAWIRELAITARLHLENFTDAYRKLTEEKR